jgi:hypothetical protein
VAAVVYFTYVTASLTFLECLVCRHDAVKSFDGAAVIEALNRCALQDFRSAALGNAIKMSHTEKSLDCTDTWKRTGILLFSNSKKTDSAELYYFDLSFGCLAATQVSETPTCALPSVSLIASRLLQSYADRGYSCLDKESISKVINYASIGEEIYKLAAQ